MERSDIVNARTHDISIDYDESARVLVVTMRVPITDDDRHRELVAERRVAAELGWRPYNWDLLTFDEEVGTIGVGEALDLLRSHDGDLPGRIFDSVTMAYDIEYHDEWEDNRGLPDGPGGDFWPTTDEERAAARRLISACEALDGSGARTAAHEMVCLIWERNGEPAPAFGGGK